VVADGMGGHQCGDLASQLIVSSIAAIARYTDLDDRLVAVRECLLGVNDRLGEGASDRAGDCAPVIGSTVVALLIEGSRAVCVWAGDSRCYLWRDQRLYQLTRDHSLLQKLIAEEQMCSREAAEHPGAHALTRAVGGGDGLSLDLIELDVRCGDVFVLCTDGLYQAIDHQVLGDALTNRSPRLSVDLLFDQVLRGPAIDNLTAVVVRT
jgi:serine/threonine-protein phosphatase Stp1